MKSQSPLNEIYKKGLYGDYENKNEENLIKIQEVSNLSIFQIVKYKNSKVSTNDLDVDGLPELEQLMLHKIYILNDNFKKYFNNYDFHNLYKELLNFCTVDLSAFYFDIRKDNLYCDSIDSKKKKVNNFDT